MRYITDRGMFFAVNTNTEKEKGLSLNNFEIIRKKLEGFIRKFYTNELIRGILICIAIGLLYFLFTAFIEYKLWLGTTARTALFWLFIAVEGFLLIRFIIWPLTKLFRLAKGIDEITASRLIGKYFPEVGDKLVNVLQLRRSVTNSELLLASIEQKSAELQPIPFRNAVNFKANLKYVPYAILPILIILISVGVGNTHWFTDGYTRVANYNQAYEAPAPFQFVVLNDSLYVNENEQYTLRIQTKGSVIPENVLIRYGDESYFLKNIAPGHFEYTFNRVSTPVEFDFQSGKVTSIPYTLNVTRIPVIRDFEMQLIYPGYIKRKSEIVKNNGNAKIPEGTRVVWKVTTAHTDKVKLLTSDTVHFFDQAAEQFKLQKNVYSNLDYQISTSNQKVDNYENLAFRIDVVRDQSPTIRVDQRVDSTNTNIHYLRGELKDDYGLSGLKLVYYAVDSPEQKEEKSMTVSGGSVDTFIYTFPNTLPLQEGKAYEYYFEVADNDAIHRFKRAKSATFTYRVSTKQERKNEQLQQQSETIEGIQKSITKQQKEQEALREMSRSQKEKNRLDFNDKKRVDDFLKRQKRQEENMKKFTQNLKENLEKQEENQPEEKKLEKDEYRDALKERIERAEKKIKKNEALLKELEKLAEQLQKEELTEKLDEYGKEKEKQERNLEQLVELTKRYYVIKKHEKLAEDLQQLSLKQEELSKKNSTENTAEEQKKLNEEFDTFSKEMKELRDSNEKLKQPMRLDQKESDEEGVREQQQEATEKLEKGQQQEAQPSQKSAAEKMKQMANQMQMESGGSSFGSAEQNEEDADMLRQVLDNLVVFSKGEEKVMQRFLKMNANNPEYAKNLRQQSVLRENFEHIDDSLFALSLRNPKISPVILDELSEVGYNMNKSLEHLANNYMAKGVISQRNVLTNSNDLAVLLSQALDQMNQQMSGGGKGKKGGKSKEFQLPDIIKKQQELSEQMKEGMEKGKDKDGKKPGESEGKKQGQGEKPGEKGEKGETGKSGKSGKSKEGQSEGKNGESGVGEGNSGENGEEKDGGQKGSNTKNGSDGKNSKGGSKNGKNGKGGKDGDGKGEEGEFGDEEDMSEQLFKIFKQQQELRQALEDKLKQNGLTPQEQGVLKRMEGVEEKLLEEGFSEETMNRMIDIKHQLFKLDKAAFQQGQDQKRESITNTKSYDAEVRRQLQKAREYFNTTEILNKQTLPLQPNYKERVRKYFNTVDD